MLFLLNNWKLLLFAGFSAVLAYGSFKFGSLTTEFEYEKEAQKFREQEAELITKLELKQAEIEDLKSKGVRRIYVEKDPTGCADIAAPDGVLAVLRGTADQPKSD